VTGGSFSGEDFVEEATGVVSAGWALLVFLGVERDMPKGPLDVVGTDDVEFEEERMGTEVFCAELLRAVDETIGGMDGGGRRSSL
jgi:hypothetical protein